MAGDAGILSVAHEASRSLEIDLVSEPIDLADYAPDFVVAGGLPPGTAFLYSFGFEGAE